MSGKSENELGGGVCQVASTIYYCAMYADLEIVERAEHQFIVDYVPGGLDATVYFGYQDFKFRNNTDYPIRIDAYLYDGDCCIELWGTNVWRSFPSAQSPSPIPARSSPATPAMSMRARGTSMTGTAT